MDLNFWEAKLLELAFFVIFIFKLGRFLQAEIGGDVGSLLTRLGQWLHRRQSHEVNSPSNLESSSGKAHPLSVMGAREGE